MDNFNKEGAEFSFAEVLECIKKYKTQIPGKTEPLVVVSWERGGNQSLECYGAGTGGVVTGP